MLHLSLLMWSLAVITWPPGNAQQSNMTNATTTVGPATVISTTTATAPLTSGAPTPIIYASTTQINASSLADVGSHVSSRSVQLNIINGAWNITWCSSDPTIYFALNLSNIQIAQPCGIIALAGQMIGVDSVSCTATTLLLVFIPNAHFALLDSYSQYIDLSFASYATIPASTVAAALEIVADQGANVTCVYSDNNASTAPSDLAPVYLPWPTDEILWDVVVGLTAFVGLTGASAVGMMHVVWLQRATMLCSRNCDWTNVTSVPLQTGPLQLTIDSPSLFPDHDAERFQPFFSAVVGNAAFASLVTCLHLLSVLLCSLVKKCTVVAAMATMRFPGSVTLPLWAMLYVSTVSAGTTILAESGSAASLSIIVPIVAAVTMLLFAAVMIGFVYMTTGGRLHARAIKVDARQKHAAFHHWTLTPTVLWGDRLNHPGYMDRFGVTFREFTMARSWYLWAELAVTTFQAAAVGYRVTWPSCQTTIFVPLAVTGIIALFLALVLDPFAALTERVAAYVFALLLVLGSAVASFAASPDLAAWATRVDEMGLFSQVFYAFYAFVELSLLGTKLREGYATTATMATESEERRLASGRLGNIALHGEPTALVADMTAEERDALREQAREGDMKVVRSLDPSILAEPDPELREVLLKGHWVRAESEDGPYYHNRTTGKSVWDLRDEIGLPPLYRPRSKFHKISDDEDDDVSSTDDEHHDEGSASLRRRLLGHRGRGLRHERIDPHHSDDELNGASPRNDRSGDAKVERALRSGEWVKVAPIGGGVPYYYHSLTRRTVWDLKKELNATDDADRRRLPPPPPPPIADRRPQGATEEAADLAAITALMQPLSPPEELTLPTRSEPLLLSPPPLLPSAVEAAGGAVEGKASSYRNPLVIFDPTTTSHASASSLMKLMQEQALKGDPIAAKMAHALATRQWIEVDNASERGVTFFVNPVTKEVTEDLRAVFESAQPQIDPVDAALASRQWIRIDDPVSRRPFFVHVMTRRVTWDLRAELEREREEERAAAGSARREASPAPRRPSKSRRHRSQLTKAAPRDRISSSGGSAEPSTHRPSTRGGDDGSGGTEGPHSSSDNRRGASHSIAEYYRNLWDAL